MGQTVMPGWPTVMARELDQIFVLLQNMRRCHKTEVFFGPKIITGEVMISPKLFSETKKVDEPKKTDTFSKRNENSK